MLVRNINETGNNPNCPCGTWIKHWERYSGRTAILCAEDACMNQATVGAHVQKDTGDKSWYIIPLCKEHNNQRGETLSIMDDTTLVSVTNRSKCGSGSK
jgi:hypothetical protein